MGNERLYYTLDSYSVPTQLQLLAPMTPTTISKIAAQYLHSAEFTYGDITVYMFGEIALVLSVKETTLVKKNQPSCLILNCIR